MFHLARALTYAVLFVGLVLIYLPARLLYWSGIVRPDSIGISQIAGIILSVIGAVIALWCVLTFANVGKGTPAPFDPPRNLVVSGPYRYVRNPMYIGGALALIGAAVFYRSVAMLAYAGAFLLLVHLFVIGYEEPTLRRTFGQADESYCERVRRWDPAL